MSRLPRQDVAGRTLRLGDWVRVLRVPEGVRALPRSSRRVFRAAVGKTFRIDGFGRYGHLELNLGRKLPGCHTIWIEPDCCSRFRRAAATGTRLAYGIVGRV